jgi:predicted phage replisome organizer
MGEVQWIKIYLDMFDRRKINKIRRLPAGNDILLFWVMLLVTAGKCNAGGMIYITERVPFTKEDLADEFDFEISTIELALKAFVEFDMIELSDDGFIYVSNWEKYQSTDRLAEIREKDRERKRLQRAKAKALPRMSEDVHGLSTDCPHIEEEGEKDKEKESHSFTQGEEAKLKMLGGTLGGGVVMLTDEQFSDLCDKLSYEELNKYIGIVRDCELNGKPYKKKTHYQAILDMVSKDRKVKA